MQRLKGYQVTFEDKASSVLSMALREGVNRMRMDIVFDTYSVYSITNSKGSACDEKAVYQLQSIKAKQIVRHWRKFLGVAPN